MAFFYRDLTLYFGKVSVGDHSFSIVLGFAIALIILYIMKHTAAAERSKKQRRRGRKSLVVEDDVPIPFDLMEGILCRLPGKSLLRFKGVCKQWLLLIKDPKFIKLHQRSTQSHTEGSRLVTFTDNKICSVDLSTLHVTKEAINQLLPNHSYLVGACNGLLCLCSGDNNTIMLWNMCTKEHKIIPPFPLQKYASNSSVVFGYDPCNDDYEVVRFCNWGHWAIFYSLRSNSWGGKHCNYYNIFQKFGFNETFGKVYLNGALSWRSRYCNGLDFIVSVDFNTGNARTLRLPYYAADDKLRVSLLDVLQGNLCVWFLKDTRCFLGNKEYGNEDVLLDIWVMKEYGNEESWTKLFSIRGMEMGNKPGRSPPYKPFDLCSW